MELIVFGLFLIAVLIGYLVSQIQSTYENMLGDLERQQSDLAKRLEELEDAAKKSRNPYLTNAGLEDTNAVLMNISETLDYLQVRTDHAQKIIGQIRSNPGGYNEDGQNGKRELK